MKAVVLMRQESDGQALELALKYKEQSSAELEITLLAMARESERRTLREGLAAGADRAVLLCDPGLAGADTLTTAKCLAAAIRKLGIPDLILCGYQSEAGRTAHLGPMTAALLNLPQLTHVTQFQWESSSRIIAVTETDVERKTCRLPSPCLLGAAPNSPGLRGVTFFGIQEAMDKEFLQWTCADLDFQPPAPTVQVYRSAAIPPRGRHKFIWNEAFRKKDLPALTADLLLYLNNSKKN